MRGLDQEREVGMVHLFQSFTQCLTDRHRAMSATRATYGDGHELLTLSYESRDHRTDHLDCSIHEVGNAFAGEDSIRDRAIKSSERTQLRIPMWIGDEAAIKDQVSIDRKTIFVTE
jgi:hypothetical protein